MNNKTVKSNSVTSEIVVPKKIRTALKKRFKTDNELMAIEMFVVQCVEDLKDPQIEIKKLINKK